ncbi:hypothetical protein [Streptomyces synnematoformans]
MKKRCSLPTHKYFHYYGGRGIEVCQRWRDSFEAFVADVGPRPTPQHTLDRINNDGNYEPGNVAWRTWKEQAANRRPQLRDTCAQGHPRTPDNVRINPKGHRECRVCDREQARAKYARRKARAVGAAR